MSFKKQGVRDRGDLLSGSSGGGGGAITGAHPALGDPTDVQELADNVDPNYRKTRDDGSTPTTLWVDSITGNDDNDGSAPGQAVATLARALQFVPEWPDNTYTINLVGAGPYSLPATVTALNRITFQGEFTDGVAEAITVEGATSRAAGLQVTGLTANVGDLVVYQTGALAGQFGRVYADVLGTLFLTQSGNTWTAPATNDEVAVRTLQTVLRSATANNPALTASHQLRFNDLIFEDMGTPETILGLATDAIVLERVNVVGSTLISGRGGSLTLRTCYVANTGAAFADRGMVTVPTGGVLQLVAGNVITGADASSSAVAHVFVGTEGVLTLAGENVFRELGDNGLFARGSDINALVEQQPTPTTRFSACANGLRLNPGVEGLGGDCSLGDVFGDVASDFVVVAQSSGYVRLGASSSVTTGTGTNDVSADGGSTASAVNRDGTRIEGGVPLPSSGVGGAARTLWFNSDLPQVQQTYNTRSIGATGNQNWNFQVPDDFGSLQDLVLYGDPSAGAAGPARSIDLISNYALPGEAITANSESDIGTLFDLTGLDGTWWGLDVSTVFSNLQPLHMCGVEIDHNGIGGGIEYMVLRMRYFPAE